MTVQTIISRFTSDVLFECEVPEGIESFFAMRYAAERAAAGCADLSGADLSGANLRYANLSGADLRDADLSGANTSTDEQSIKNLDKVRAIILDDNVRLEMGHWHGDNGEWRAKTCAEEAVCGTTHCLAGWLQVCATDPDVRAMDTQLAGIVQAPVAAKMFFRKSDEVLAWLTDRKYVADIEEVNRKAAKRAKRKSGGAA